MTQSIWQDQQGRSYPPLEGNQSCDLAVIGAGMTGLGTALYCARRGLRCAVIERGRIGCGASGRNVGMVITGLGEHYARSIAGFGRARAREIWEINRCNHQLLRDLIAAEVIRCEYQRTGSFALGWDEDECADLEASLRPLAEDGFAADLLGEADLKRVSGISGCSKALYVPEDAQLHPVRLLQGMAAAVVRRGIPIFQDSPVLSLRGEPSGRGFRLELVGGRMSCHSVVLATNAYTSQLFQEYAGWIEPIRGQCLAAVIPDGIRMPAPAYSDRGHVYWRTLGNRLAIGGFDKLAPQTECGYVDATTPLIQEALESFAASLAAGRWRSKMKEAGSAGSPSPGTNQIRNHDFAFGIAVTHRWSGVMGYARDWFPIIGERPHGSGLYIAAGFTGHGFGYALQAAMWLSQLVSGGRDEIPDFLSVRRMERKAAD